MIRIIDTYPQIASLFVGGCFSIERWEAYIDSAYKGSAELFKKDMQECLDGGYSYEKDFLPVLNAVCGHESLETLHTSFLRTTDGLDEKIAACFGGGLDVDIVLYVGLCNGAGWVTRIHERDVILLGVEKILELGWFDMDAMCGLIDHELGHVYHRQNGAFDQQAHGANSFIRQLFIEGVAMVFEQELVGSDNYFHQNKNGWLDWCEAHFNRILTDFHADLPTMTRFTQRYFGDWVSYCGRGDVG